MRWTLRMLARDPPGNYAYLFKKQWKLKAKQVIQEQQISPELAAQLARDNQMVIDPNVDQEQRISLNQRKYYEPLERIAAQIQPATLPARAGPLVHYYSMDEPLTAGLQQAALLTKSIIMHDPPKAYVDAYNKLELPANSTEMFQRIFMHSHIWNTDEDKLPKRWDKENPLKWFHAEYGVLPENAVRYLLDGVIRYGIQTQSARFPALFERRRLLKSTQTVAKCNLHGAHVEIAFDNDFHIGSIDRIGALANDDAVQASVNVPLRSIAPISPLVDFVRSDQPWPVLGREPNKGRVPHAASQTGLEFSSNRLHTNLFTINFGRFAAWSNRSRVAFSKEQREAAAVLHCFAHAIAEAHRDEAIDDKKLLAKPIVTQAIVCDGVTADLCWFQLNTLNLADVASGVKNIAFVQSGLQLAQADVPREIVSKKRVPHARHTQYSNFDPDAFRKLIAMLIVGL